MSWQIIEHEGRRIRVAVVRANGGTWVGFPGGSRFVADPSSPQSRGAVVSADAVAAPMTAKVIQVRATVGAQVAEGDLLVVLEAMKMEYRLTAPRAGSVAKVACKEGELVDLGRVLVELERDSPK